MDAEQLAGLAVELAVRVRCDDVDDTADWFRAVTTEAERWALLFVQAAANPPTVAGFQRATAWVAKREERCLSVDDVAVERAIQGQPVPLNRLERAAAVKRLHRRGASIRETAKVIGVDRRWISRVRGGHVKYAREVA